MNCQNCGHANEAGATTCSNCGASLADAASSAAPPSPPMPPAPPAAAPLPPPAAAPVAGPAIANNLVWAILATICCCLPTGIVSIIYAAQVDGKVASGDYAGAQQAADNAKLWAWVSLGLGLLGGLAYFGLAMVGAVADMQNY